MALSAGTRLGPYEILALLGAGGMGEVYRATDTRLGRDVAIKILPPEVVKDPGRRARFEREAHLLASLNHPNIAAIHGLEEDRGQPFLVLELVEGQDLKERLEGGAIPVAEALEIALQVAEALEEAHNTGIVHRDLKPANVKLTPDGKVKVLDFGLAKACAEDVTEGNSARDAMSQAPTLAYSGTHARVLLGTPSYMSPEQSRGKPVDKRSDVWAFGVLLWEILTARTLFTGDSITDVFAAVVKEEPDLDALPAETPPAVRQLLARCLRKDPRTRLPDIGAARLELQDLLSGTDREPSDGGGGPAVEAEVRRLTRQRGAWVVAFLAAAVVAGTLAVRQLTRAPGPESPVHLSLELPEGVRVSGSGEPAVSPDGLRVAFVAARAEGPPMIWVHPLDSPTSRSLPGTEGATSPFWSPDGTAVGYFVEGELRRVDLTSGDARRLAVLPGGSPRGGTWNSEGTILFSMGRLNARLYTVPAIGGEPGLLTRPDTSRGEATHWWPQFLPDGRRFLFQSYGTRAEGSGVFLASLDAPDERRRLLPASVRARYGAGHLLFPREGTLFAQPFDAERAELKGEPVPIAFDVAIGGAGNLAYFSGPTPALLAFFVGGASDWALEWLDREGTRLGGIGDPGPYGQIALSPDEKHVAVEMAPHEGGATNLWTIELDRGIATRVTTGSARDGNPVWSPDGRELAFSSNRDGTYRLYRKNLRGNEPASLVPNSPAIAFAEQWSQGGGVLLYNRSVDVGHTVEAISLDPGAEPETLLQHGGQLDEPQVSPDGRWLAYISDESGAFEVYVEPLRRAGERVRVSPDGGGQPRWRGDGNELFYVSPAAELMAVDVRTGETSLDVGLPAVLFGGVRASPTTDEFAVTADGQRFLVKVPTGDSPGPRVRVILDWTSLLPR